MYEENPWHGASQGAADATLHYIVLSDMLIDAYHSHFQPWTIQDPTLTITILKSIKACIDDVVMSAGDTSCPFQDLVQRAQSQLQWWNQLVQSSGSALNPSKCYCAIYHWQPNKDGILHQNDPDPATSLIRADPLNPTQQIPLLPLNVGTRYLGIYIT